MSKKEIQIIGRSEQIIQIQRTIEQVAPTNISILITGESGTGKEVIANSIHQKSLRKEKEIVIVNCGAIPEGILESELFGHEKGSFTGAVGRRKGYFEIADKGTILLDEIGEMPLQTQVKFLRVLESGEFMRVGGSETIRVDVRIIAATNKDLEEAVDKNEFRKDLYYRLKAITVYVPPLSERKEDIELLAEKFIYDYVNFNNLPRTMISPEAMSALKQYSWPGNIRELKNLLESLVVLKQGKYIELSDLPENIMNFSYRSDNLNLPVRLNKTADQVERELIYRTLLALREDISEIKGMMSGRRPAAGFPHGYEDVFSPEKEVTEYIAHGENENDNEFCVRDKEKGLIIDALRHFGGNRKEAANALGISERTLYRKLKELGLSKK